VAAFDYVALDHKGREKKGTLEGDSSRQVRQVLRDKGMIPLSVESAGNKAKEKGAAHSRWNSPSLGVQDLALITRQMATLVQAGLPIEEVMTAVSQQSDKPKQRSMLLAVRSKVLEGFSLADSLSEFPRAFPKLYRATVSAGEHAGHLDLVLNRLADYTESTQESRTKIQMAMMYPIILVCLSILIVTGLMGYVVPDVVKVFVDTGQALPMLTTAMIALSDFVVHYGIFVFLLIVLAVIGFNYALRNDAFRLKCHRRLLHTPLVRKISRGTNTARFASTLSILTSSGVPLVDAMKIAGEVVSNDWIRLQVRDATKKVGEGASLKNALDQTGYFPPMMLHMIASGEASGELDNMLERTAIMQEKDMANTITLMVGLFEPMMLVFMGGVVLTIVLAIMLPILNLNQLVK